MNSLSGRAENCKTVRKKTNGKKKTPSQGVLPRSFYSITVSAVSQSWPSPDAAAAVGGWFLGALPLVKKF